MNDHSGLIWQQRPAPWLWLRRKRWLLTAPGFSGQQSWHRCRRTPDAVRVMKHYLCLPLALFASSSWQPSSPVKGLRWVLTVALLKLLQSYLQVVWQKWWGVVVSSPKLHVLMQVDRSILCTTPSRRFQVLSQACGRKPWNQALISVIIHHSCLSGAWLAWMLWQHTAMSLFISCALLRLNQTRFSDSSQPGWGTYWSAGCWLFLSWSSMPIPKHCL